MLYTRVMMRWYHNAKFIEKMKGLDPEKYYNIEGTDEVYSGALLMNAGINLTEYRQGDGNSFVLHFVEVK